MIIVSIKKDGQITNQGSFDSMQAAQEWLAYHEGLKTFGQKAEVIQQQVEIQPAVLDEQGVEISPAQYEMQEISIPGYEVEIEDKSAQVAEEAARQAKIDAGRKARQACEEVLDLIAGYNLERELSMEQITQMQQTFELAERALRAGRPSLAKGAISLIHPDGMLVTEEMKQGALDLLADY